MKVERTFFFVLHDHTFWIVTNEMQDVSGSKSLTQFSKVQKKSVIIFSNINA